MKAEGLTDTSHSPGTEPCRCDLGRKSKRPLERPFLQVCKASISVGWRRGVKAPSRHAVRLEPGPDQAPSDAQPSDSDRAEDSTCFLSVTLWSSLKKSPLGYEPENLSAEQAKEGESD